MIVDFKPGAKIEAANAKRAVMSQKPEFLFVTASLAVLLSIAPQFSRADGDPRIGKLIAQSGAALHFDALRSVEVIHEEGSVVAAGLSGSDDNWNEMGGMR
jgi:hypothetical protein